jgi:hypothetical protein
MGIGVGGGTSILMYTFENHVYSYFFLGGGIYPPQVLALLEFQFYSYSYSHCSSVDTVDYFVVAGDGELRKKSLACRF